MRFVYVVLFAFTFSVFAQAASAAGTLPQCSLASEGIFKGTWVKHRIYVEDDVVFGANDLNSILVQLDNLRGQGLCR